MISADEPVSNRKRWIVAGVAIAMLMAVAYASAFFFAGLFDNKPAASIDELDAAEVAKLSVFVLNRPDGGPDITRGGGELLNIPQPEVESILATLRGARPITAERAVFLGRMEIALQDGRKLTVMLHRDASDKSASLQYRIGNHGYEGQSLTAFLAALDAMEARLKTGQ